MSLPRQFPVPEAIDDVIVHHAYGLHEGVTDGAAHELETTPFQVGAHGVGFYRPGIVFRLAEIVEALKGDGQDSVAQNSAVKALVFRLAWLTGITLADAYCEALDDCLAELDDDHQQAVLESMQTEAVRLLL